MTILTAEDTGWTLGFNTPDERFHTTQHVDLKALNGRSPMDLAQELVGLVYELMEKRGRRFRSVTVCFDNETDDVMAPILTWRTGDKVELLIDGFVD